MLDGVLSTGDLTLLVILSSGMGAASLGTQWRKLKEKSKPASKQNDQFRILDQLSGQGEGITC